VENYQNNTHTTPGGWDVSRFFLCWYGFSVIWVLRMMDYGLSPWCLVVGGFFFKRQNQQFNAGVNPFQNPILDVRDQTSMNSSSSTIIKSTHQSLPFLDSPIGSLSSNFKHTHIHTPDTLAMPATPATTTTTTMAMEHDDNSKIGRSNRSGLEIAKRKAEAERIRQKYTDRIPVSSW
jgi:hypothetical protein